MSNRSLIFRILGGIWRALDRLRRALQLILVLGIFAVLLAALAPDVPVVPDSAALVVAPQGRLVDQLSGDAFDLALAKAQGLPPPETLLQDIIDAVRLAKDDTRIKTLVLQLDGLSESGLSKLQELAGELEAFRESGKPIVALGNGFEQHQYYLAAQADELYMHPMGVVLIDGYSRFLPYFKTALDKLYIDYNVWTVGEYKSFVEPYTRDDMSDEDKLASEAYLNALWEAYQADVGAARDLPDGSLQRYADEIVSLLREAGGDAARMAVDFGLVDELMTRDRMRDRIHELVGDETEDTGGYSRIDHLDYLTAMRVAEPPPARDDMVAVIVASGTILDGVQPPGTIGGDSMADLIRRATDDEDVDALVLRVDSPGGSAFASDLILREIEVFQASGRPVVVSMSSLAASGGYWISMSADEIWASSTTLTGSIGVGATIPTFQRTLDQLGIHVDGIGTTDLAGQFDITQGLGDDAKDVIAQSVNHIYDEFIDKVATHRQRSVDQINEVARGRVWVGSHARERGLVDELGDLQDAIGAAAELAGLAEDSYNVRYYEPELSLAEQMIVDLLETVAPAVAALGFKPRLPAALSRLLAASREPLAFLERFNDPRGLYLYCFCDVR